jgi:ABC-type transport system involved in multi-copper enzyme maturation permease subunit
LIFSALQYFQSGRIQDGVAAVVVFSLVAGLVLRFGLLALATFIFVDSLVTYTQVTTSTSAWYFGHNVLLLASVLALAAWGFHTSTAGRRLWKPDLLS